MKQPIFDHFGQVETVVSYGSNFKLIQEVMVIFIIFFNVRLVFYQFLSDKISALGNMV